MYFASLFQTISNHTVVEVRSKIFSPGVSLYRPASDFAVIVLDKWLLNVQDRGLAVHPSLTVGKLQYMRGMVNDEMLTE